MQILNMEKFEKDAYILIEKSSLRGIIFENGRVARDILASLNAIKSMPKN